MISWIRTWTLHDKKYGKKQHLHFNRITDPTLTRDYESTIIEVSCHVIICRLDEIIKLGWYYEHDKRLLSMLREYYYKNLQGLFEHENSIGETKKINNEYNHQTRITLI